MVAFFKVALLFLLLYTLILFFIYFTQSSFIFFPNKARHTLTANIAHNVEEYEFRKGNVSLRGWLVHPQNIHTILIYYGGNAEDIYYSIDDFLQLEGIATLLVNYRGYGTSDGQPSEENLFEDALQIHDDLHSRFAPDNVFLMGRSLGSGVATYVASRRKIRGTLLITPYDSISNMARRSFPWLPTSVLLKHRFNSLEYVKKMTSPSLVLYAGNDDVIPNALTRNLIAKLPEPKSVHLLAEADHNNISMFPAYWLHIIQFLDNHSHAPTHRR